MPDLALPLVLVAAGAAHAVGSVVVARRRQRPLDVGPPTAFLVGLAVVAFAIVGPLDRQAESRLSAHMVQHLLLISVAAPLLALGRPVLLAASLVSDRQSVDRRPLGATAAATSAVASLAVLFVWHIPALYDAALRNENLHGIEHLSLLASVMLLWHALLRARYLGAGVLWLYLVTVPMTAFGVAMTISHTPWYGFYTGDATPADAVRDQQLAGVIMWGFGGLAAVVAAVSLFAAWLLRLEPVRGPIDVTSAS